MLGRTVYYRNIAQWFFSPSKGQPSLLASHVVVARWIKTLIATKREPPTVSIKNSRHAAIQLTEDVDSMDCTEEMQNLYDAAAFLRKSINNSKKWVFTRSLNNVSNEHLPDEISSFFDG